MLEAVILQVGMVSLTCSAVLLPLLLLLRRLRRRYAARTCYFLWLLLALRLALPFPITLPTPAVTVGPHPIPSRSPATGARLSSPRRQTFRKHSLPRRRLRAFRWNLR